MQRLLVAICKKNKIEKVDANLSSSLNKENRNYELILLKINFGTR